jgi:HAD superfamily hydrolase (TIGR01509 family)
MINAVIFDLDGTLIETEKLKAQAYARAAIELCPEAFDEQEVLDAFGDFVGGSRREVSLGLMDRFNLAGPARKRMAEFGASEPWQVFTQLRLQILEVMLADEVLLRSHRRAQPLSLLQTIKTWQCKVGLATMSRCEQATRTLKVLGLADAFDFIATREDVENPKPDPEIYLLVADVLQVPIGECMVLEDSVAGVQAGLAAGALVVAFATTMTREKLHQFKVISPYHIVEDSEDLQATVDRLFKLYNDGMQPDGI